MSRKQELLDYLNGSSDEVQTRSRLAAEGLDIIPQMLEVLLELLKSWGRYAATQASSLDAENQIDQSARRAQDLVTAIASISSQQSTRVAARLVESMQDRNPSIRALAVMMCMAGGVPAAAYSQAVVQCFVRDAAYLPKLAASICMSTVQGVPENVLKMAGGVASDWISQYVLPTYPHLVRKVQSSLGNADEGLRTVVIGVGAVYREIARS